MSEAFSLVCAAGHVMHDDLDTDPGVRGPADMRCDVSGCFERVYSQCPNCEFPVPGYIDGPRIVDGAPKGRMNTARGMYPNRVWLEACPNCSSPYPLGKALNARCVSEAVPRRHRNR